MRTTSLLALLAGTAIAQVATVTQFVTVPDATPTPTSVQQVKQLQSTSSDSDTSITAPSTFATMVSSTATDMTSTASSASATSTANYGSEPGSSTNDVDTDAGASGTGSSFSISTGGLAAIIVIVVLVAIFAIASLSLWIIAKRRQETMRTSLARISRRITAPLTPGPRPGGSSNRRTTVHRGEFAEPGKPRGHKRGLRIEETEMEKGAGGRSAAREVVGKKSGWTQRLWGNDWR